MKQIMTFLRKRALKENILLFFVGLWILIATLNVFYNAGKTVFEVKEWAFLSETEKRYKLFGDLHNFFIFIGNNTEIHDQILIYSKDIKTFYLSKYYLYPRVIYSTDNVKEFMKLANNNDYKYIAVFENDFRSSNYEMVAFVPLQKLTGFSLYKRK